MGHCCTQTHHAVVTAVVAVPGCIFTGLSFQIQCSDRQTHVEACPKMCFLLLQVLTAIASASSSISGVPQSQTLRQAMPARTVIGLFRDLRGIAMATSSRRSYGGSNSCPVCFKGPFWQPAQSPWLHRHKESSIPSPAATCCKHQGCGSMPAACLNSPFSLEPLVGSPT